MKRTETTPNCRHCKTAHRGVEVTYTEKGGRWRLAYTCPASGHSVSQFCKAPGASKPKKTASKPRKKTTTPKEAPVPRSTKQTGGLRNLAISIPMTNEATPDISAAWTIAEAILDRLGALTAAPGSLQDRADAAYRQSQGLDNDADQVERQVGEAIAEAMVLVAVRRRMTAEQWAALSPVASAEQSYFSQARTALVGAPEGGTGALGVVGDALEVAAAAAGLIGGDPNAAADSAQLLLQSVGQ